MELTSKNVQDVLVDCLYPEAEGSHPPEGSIQVEGIVRKYAFHPERIKEHEQDIRLMLDDLPKEFHKGTGDGYSFLAACNNREGKQWTGEHMIMEMLFCLGMGIGAVTCLLPREMWSILPGAVPYYRIDLQS